MVILIEDDRVVNLMRAVVATDYGVPETLVIDRVPVPRPGPGQVQVRLRAAALNPADLRMLSGVLRGLLPLTFPHVPGSDFAGTVTEVGAEVVRFVAGDEVFGTGMPGAGAAIVADPPSSTTGAMAEYAVYDADTPALARRPAELSAEHAATLPIPGLTALAVLRAGAFVAGETVLVAGAAGGTGGAVVPLLAAAGVRVLATAPAEDADAVRELGAAEVLDYRTVDVAEQVHGVDGLVNLALSGPELVRAASTVAPGGRLVNVAYPSPDPSHFPDLTVRTVYGIAGPGDLDRLAGHALSGVLPSTVTRRYPLAQAPQAYLDLVHTHVRGKLLVTMD